MSIDIFSFWWETVLCFIFRSLKSDGFIVEPQQKFFFFSYFATIKIYFFFLIKLQYTLSKKYFNIFYLRIPSLRAWVVKLINIVLQIFFVIIFINTFGMICWLCKCHLFLNCRVFNLQNSHRRFTWINQTFYTYEQLVSTASAGCCTE